VEIDGIVAAGFSEVQIGETVTEVIDYREGNEPLHVRASHHHVALDPAAFNGNFNTGIPPTKKNYTALAAMGMILHF
jgi:hypothetical protein